MKLSICLPTFNRSAHVINQMSFIVDEIYSESYFDNVEIILSDNNSDVSEQERILDFVNNIKKRYCNISIQDNYNLENIGPTNNYKKLVSLSKGRYVWLVGDDDILYKGILKEILENINFNKGLIFLNHRAVNNKNEVLMPMAFDVKQHCDLYDVFKYSKTTMMFITACVYRADLIKEIFQQEDARLSLPFYTSLKCAEKAGVKFIDKIYIDNYWGETSWSSSSFDVFFKQVPMDLFRSISFSNNKFKTGVVCSRYVFALLIRATKSLIIKIIKKMTKQ